MDIEFNDVLARYGAEIAKLTERAIIAEAQRDQLARELEQNAEPVKAETPPQG